MPVSENSNAHQPAYLESFLPAKPLDFPCAATAESSSKKSKMILALASEAMLIGMNVAKASGALFESAGSHQSGLKTKDRGIKVYHALRS